MLVTVDYPPCETDEFSPAIQAGVLLIQSQGHQQCRETVIIYPVSQILPLAANPCRTEHSQGKSQAAQMKHRDMSKHGMAEIPVLLSSTLLVKGEVWLADVARRLMP